MFAWAVLAPPPAAAQTFEAERIEKSMVRILVGPQGRIVSSGSGFVLNSQGYIGTNWHVVTNTRAQGGPVWETKLLILSGTNQRIPFTVIWRSMEFDLAIIKTAAAINRPPMSLTTKLPNKGKTVYALGFPGGADLGTSPIADPTVTTGILGRIYQGNWGRGGQRFTMLQHSAQTNPGNSGGPLFDECGRVIGVNTGASLITVVLPGGKQTRVPRATGIFWSSQITVLMESMRKNNVNIQPVTSVCSPVVAAGGSGIDPAALKAIEDAKKRLAAQEAQIAKGEVLTKAALDKARKAEAAAKLAEEKAILAKIQADLAGEKVQTITTQLLIWGPIFAILLAVTLALALRKPRQQIIRVGREYSQRVSRRLSRPVGEKDAHHSGICLAGFDDNGSPIRVNIEADRMQGADGAVLGRSPELANYVIAGTGVSRRQARITVAHHRVMIEDMNSTNGTRVN
ncbi:MAG: trypsin-like peptidase domain-containing protein, partial [Sphingomonadales bacterium]